MPALYASEVIQNHVLERRQTIGELLTPNATQRTTLIVAGVYVIVIGILWVAPVLNWIIYPFKLLTVGFHEMSHALAGVLTGARIKSIELDPDEGGATRMSGVDHTASRLPWKQLHWGRLIACGFDTTASKIACIILAVFFIFTLWWARKNWLTWALVAGLGVLIILSWFIADSVALRYVILFVGVMSCMYSIWDIIDDTIDRKINESDASKFAEVCGCCGSQVWGVFWLIISFLFFILGILVGVMAFKESAAQQAASNFLDSPIH
ncbi:hypothetical protein FRB95_009011 [Tulasnella sp. JGI-2019a]|nr:hypothetical protein FRB95_009011 [Tulasnella sp. JGI-2019a]